MKTYSRTETIARMNALAGANVPFLFIVDYAQEQSHIEPLDRIDPATCLFQFPKAGNTETAATALARSTAARCAGPIQWDITPPSPAAYRHSFDLVKQNLLAGNSYLTNLTCRVPVTTNLTLEEIFLHSEALYKLWLKDRFVCFSPEIFVRIEKGKIKSFPMKGTIDATLPDAEQLLMQDTKEAAEHATIVDLIRNDLSMVSEHVEVTSYRYIDRLQTNKGPILQTSSEICGTLPEDYTAHLGDIIFRLLPAGSITGAPKPKTVEIIAQAEDYRRGLHRHHGALCRRTAGQRCHDTLHRAGKRPAPLQGRRRHHRQKPVGKRIQRSNTEDICAYLLKPYASTTEGSATFPATTGG